MLRTDGVTRTTAARGDVVVRDRLRQSREALSGTTRDVSRGVSDNDRKYYSIERAREVLGYDPQDNSAEWDGDERDT
jgi:hypothetical protein